MEHTQLGGDVGIQNGAALLMSLGVIVVMVLGTIWAIGLAARTLVGVGRIQVVPALRRWWWGRLLRVRPPVTTATSLLHGQPARLTGVVEAVGLARATFSGVGVVVCEHAFGEFGGAVLGHGLCARDFQLRLEDGTPVRVWAAAAARRGQLRVLDASPHRWHGRRSLRGWFRESRVVPGDLIELCGVAGLQVDADAPRLSDRQPPVCWTLAPAGGHLVLRFGTRAHAVSQERLAGHAPGAASDSDQVAAV
jgi:hypothetical protein